MFSSDKPQLEPPLPEISVVIPSYNHARYIAGAVKSVLDQTITDLEIIVVDDGSQDDSLSILKNFTDPRLKVFTQSNQGAHAAINRGLDLSSANLLAILNSDDQYHPQRLEKIASEFKKNPHMGMIGSYLEIIDANDNQTGIKYAYHNCEPWLLEKPERSFRSGKSLPAALLTENYWATTSNFVFSRPAYDTVGPFKPLRYSHDWDFALRLSSLFPIMIFPEPLARYRVHPRNTIRENQAAMIFEICWILAVHLPEKMRKMGIPADNQFIDQLLHSIYTYQCDRVLVALLLQGLADHSSLASDLLENENPIRMVCLDYIQRRLQHTEETPSHATEVASPSQKLFRKVRRYLRPLKAAWLRWKR
jgi:GT2 family glycosyltransferase